MKLSTIPVHSVLLPKDSRGEGSNFTVAQTLLCIITTVILVALALTNERMENIVFESILEKFFNRRY